ncbi:LysR family transcriptional regulator [Halalkalibacillus halophilus]|uniref:LysR family transcriptional regulator n=1 Tax=Halalkalibacillus halophilus TaxID=392827 RepID=UPI0004241A56|nr:LysR family transcriptional regulator [Halalkalibacillus halophilus]
MNTSWLRTFVVAAKYENYHKTSEILFLSQPTVSVHIKQLEKAVGVKLFSKSGRNVHLTPYGREFLNHAKSILNIMDDSLVTIDRLRQGYFQELTVAVSPLVAATYLPYWMKQFVKAHAQIEVVIEVMESEIIPDAIVQGKADLGLSRMESKRLEVTCEKLYEEPLKVVCPHDGGDAESSLPIDLEQLMREELLLTHNHPEYWENMMIEIKSIYPHVKTMKVSQVHVTKRFIEEGIGFSFLPRSIVKKEIIEGRILEVKPAPLSLPKAATYAITKHKSEETSKFIETVKRLV